ncbi:MAG: PTS sugar transporter subunit IIC [Brevinema sp.]
MDILNFIINDILGQAPILIALIAMVGLGIQNKGIGKIIEGTFKTLLGFLIMLAGINIMVQTLTFLGIIFQQGFGLKGYVSEVGAIAGMAQRELGREVSLTLLTIFIVNIIIARFTKFKYIFLTGQALLWMATIGVVTGYMTGITGAPLILISGLVGGILAVFMPAIAQPVVRKITGNDNIALGHFCTVGYIFEAAVAKVFGNTKHSTEDIELPKGFSFLQDSYLTMAIVMLPLYIIPAIVAGPTIVAEYAGNQHYLVYTGLESMNFVVGMYVLTSGVRMLLNEIVPAFRGIALKVVPDAIPALDCPVLFPYAPNAVLIGFLSTTIGSIIGMFLFPMFGMALILPGMLTNFFAGGTAGVFGNALGGRRGAIIGGIAHGIFITWLPACLVPMIESYGFEGVTFSDSDVIINGLVMGNIYNQSYLFSVLLVLFIVLMTLFVFASLKKEAKMKN